MQTPAFFRFLGRRNTLVIVAFLLAWLIGLDLIWYLPTRQSLENSASELSLQVAESASASVDAFLASDLSSVEDAASDITATPKDTQGALDRLIRHNPFVLHAALVDRNGTLLAESGTFPQGQSDPDYSKLPGVYVAFAGSANFGTVSTLSDGTSVSYVSVPVETNGLRTAVVVAEVSIQPLKDSIATLKGGSWHIYVTDKDGNEIIGLETGQSAQDLLARPIVQKVVVDGEVANGLAADDPYVNAAGVRVFAVGKPIALANWSLFVERPMSEALGQEAVIGFLAIAIFVLGAISILVAMLSYWRLDLLNARLITQRAELKEKNDRLQELDTMKSEFVSVAAHQLRTPLSALKWTFESLLSDETLTAELRSTMLKGADSNERMIRLVEDMLAVTRIEAGRVRYSFAPLHIEDVIDNILLDFVGQARTHHLALTFEKPDGQLPYISADPQRLRDVIGNLLENAIRYTPEGGTITIRATSGMGYVRVEVKDNGIGIPLAQQPNIFNKFFRAENAAKMQTDGTGLGLFIAKATVEKHGGKIWFESTPGAGTSFFFTIPIMKES